MVLGTVHFEFNQSSIRAVIEQFAGKGAAQVGDAGLLGALIEDVVDGGGRNAGLFEVVTAADLRDERSRPHGA